MNRILITGAGSMIGTALTELLLAEGKFVTAIIRRGSEKLSHINNDKLNIIECDLSELRNLSIDEKHDAFIHLAWASTYGEQRDDALTQAKNIEYTLNAAEAAKKAGCECFVTVGSQAEYGRVSKPLRSDTAINPESGYGVAKYASAKLSDIFCRQNGIRHCHARVLSVYGGRDRDETLISTCIDSMIKGIAPSLTGCEQMWDYIYVDDAANALKLIAEKGKDKAVYTVGSGECRPLSYYVDIIKRETGFNGEIGYFKKTYSENQVMYLCADITELMMDTGFEAATSFEDGIKRCIDFRKDRCRK